MKTYDVVIVGAGIAGAIVARTLSEAGKRVLVLEAGLASGGTLDDGAAAQANYLSYLQRFYTAMAKVPNAPYPNLSQAPSPDVLDIENIQGTTPDTNGYFVQTGPLPFASDYIRVPGGTTMHWLGTTLRMLPNDFRMQSMYGRGVDWPIAYEELRPYYEMAEREIGVSGNVADQRYPGVDPATFWGPDYVLPMREVPTSYLDKCMTDRVGGMTVNLPTGRYTIDIISTPQGRNSIPNLRYGRTSVSWNEQKRQLELGHAPGAIYQPVGSVWDPNTGERCEGNASCVPICPVQAKYNAQKTLRVAVQGTCDVVNQAVASKLQIDRDNGRITGITYTRYDTETGRNTVETARGTIFVLAAHAVENAKLLLASDACRTSGQVGRNLMDHTVFFAWGLLPEKGWPYRGPGSTSNIPTFRDGAFRKDHAAFILPIDNWGWSWPVGSPQTQVQAAVNQGNQFGRALRAELADSLPRQVFIHYEVEQLPSPDNRVRIDPAWRDELGNYRPVIQYSVDDYSCRAFEAATQMTAQMFAYGGIRNHTVYNPTDTDYLIYNGVGYSFQGAGHLVGTHRMGRTATDSVVDRNQRAWDHENLYLVGCGNMPTLGTSNPTLTMSALAFWAAENILRDLSA